MRVASVGLPQAASKAAQAAAAAADPKRLEK